jgi:hypothetical protein
MTAQRLTRSAKGASKWERMEKVVKIYGSFKEQEKDDVAYWKNLSGDQKLEILEIIRANYWALRNEHPGRLQRVCRIIKRT